MLHNDSIYLAKVLVTKKDRNGKILSFLVVSLPLPNHSFSNSGKETQWELVMT